MIFVTENMSVDFALKGSDMDYDFLTYSLVKDTQFGTLTYTTLAALKINIWTSMTPTEK